MIELHNGIGARCPRGLTLALLLGGLLVIGGCADKAKKLSLEDPARQAFVGARIIEPGQANHTRLNRWSDLFDATATRPMVSLNAGPQVAHQPQTSLVALRYHDEKESRILWTYDKYGYVVSTWLSADRATFYFTVLESCPHAPCRSVIYAYDLNKRKMRGMWAEFEAMQVAEVKPG
jgi:hypothetical protein